MLYTETNCLPGNNSTRQTQQATKNASQGYVHNIPAESLKACILVTHELSRPIEELVATGEAVFALIRNSEMELETKNAFHRLEMQFEFYRQLLEYQD